MSKGLSRRDVAAGACGAPTFLVRDGAGGSELVWGQDRWDTVADELIVSRAMFEALSAEAAPRLRTYETELTLSAA